MAEALHWTDTVQAIAVSFAVIVAIFSAIVACLARSDSKKAAQEAAQARKIAQSELLSPHFSNITGVLERIKARDQFNTTTDKIVLSAESVRYLKSMLAGDNVMQDCLEKIGQMLSKPHPYSREKLYAASSGFSVERFYGEYGETIKLFENKQREYLSIG